MTTPTHCPDCLKDGRESTLIHDPKHNGDVCARCGRVFNPTFGKLNFHYVDKKSRDRRINRDKKSGRGMSLETQALVENIMRRD